jgi:hypothetical protein
MKRTHTTTGHLAPVAASRLHVTCGQVSYPWSADARFITQNVMNEFADTSKATRRRKESSP